MKKFTLFLLGMFVIPLFATAQIKITDPSDLVYPQPAPPREDGAIVQWNNLLIYSIEKTTSQSAQIIARSEAMYQGNAPVSGGISPRAATGNCYSFKDLGSSQGTSVLCPETPLKLPASGASSSANAASAPTSAMPAYKISVNSGTRLLLRDRSAAALSDFNVGDRINVLGFYKEGTIEALILRNLSKPEEKRFIQLNNVNVVSVSGNTLPADIVVVQKDNFPCYDFGERGDLKKPYPCPAGLKSFNDDPRTKNLNTPASLMPIINTGRKYIVHADAGTIFLNREKIRILLSDISAGDELNVYGAVGNQTEIIEADIVRDLSKPLKPATPEQIKGTITQVNPDGSFTLQTEDGRLITVKNPFQVGASVSVKGILDGISGILSNISEILLKSGGVQRGTIKIKTSSELQGIVGKYFNAAFEAHGGSAPYEFGVSAGNLPPGLTLQKPVIYCIQAPCPQPMQTSISLQGTPASAGTYKFQLTAKDSTGNTNNETFAVSIRSDSTSQTAPAILNILPASGPVGTKVTLTGTGLYAAGGGNALFRNDIFMNDALIWPSVNFSKDGTKLEFEVTGPPCGASLGCAYTPLSPGAYAVHIVNGIGKSNSVTFTVTQ